MLLLHPPLAPLTPSLRLFSQLTQYAHMLHCRWDNDMCVMKSDNWKAALKSWFRFMWMYTENWRRVCNYSWWRADRLFPSRLVLLSLSLPSIFCVGTLEKGTLIPVVKSLCDIYSIFMQTWAEHENSPNWESSPGPSCCEVTGLTNNPHMYLNSLKRFIKQNIFSIWSTIL